MVCPLTGRSFLIFRRWRSFQLSLVEALEPTTFLFRNQLAAIHFQQMLGGRDGLTYSRKVGFDEAWRNREDRHAVRLQCILACRMELTL